MSKMHGNVFQLFQHLTPSFFHVKSHLKFSPELFNHGTVWVRRVWPLTSYTASSLYDGIFFTMSSTILCVSFPAWLIKLLKLPPCWSSTRPPSVSTLLEKHRMRWHRFKLGRRGTHILSTSHKGNLVWLIGVTWPLKCIFFSCISITKKVRGICTNEICPRIWYVRTWLHYLLFYFLPSLVFFIARFYEFLEKEAD